MAKVTADTVELDFSKLSMHDKKRDVINHGPLKEIFYLVQCPYTWPEQMSHEKLEEMTSDKCNLVVGDPKEWNQFCLHIYYAYGHAKLGNMDRAFDFSKMCEDLIRKSSEDDFFKEIYKAMTHCLYSLLAHMYFIKCDPEKADQMISKVTPVQDLDPACQAALKAIYATVSHEFGLRPKEDYLKTFKEAIDLDPDEKGYRRGAWYYSVGKLIGQLRRRDYRTKPPSAEELEYLTRATKINPFPVFLATLAEAKRELARYGFNTATSHTLNMEAKKLFIEAYKKDSVNASTLRRCGKGLMSLPRECQDIPLAKECLEKAIKLDPGNSPSLYSLGNLEERYNGNIKKAIEYYQLAVENGNAVAAISEIRLRFKQNRQYYPIDYCDKLITEYPEVPSLHVAKMEYYLFVKNDILSAAKEFEKAHVLSPGSDSLKKHWKVFLPKQAEGGKFSVDAYMVMRNAIRRAKPTLSAEDKLYLDGMVKICATHA
ncbi:uncharacterized protein LOC124160860 [Ischnura elegans]|uniref:uncharacterized protein LOC124160860 n=1 Tax=Ischnura elegans TaxID=197161 RepID=UPI001ED8A4A4|nr:uncharacterized protein LOC124160860 [Ischnura elegans]XP_046392920.1 uncharacterized protein LOC124160860 [Ischnura elegans]